jgi:hypothetical protein
MGIGGFGFKDVARALYDQTDGNLRDLALGLGSAGIGASYADIASAIWNMGIGGISKSNIVDALVNGIGGISVAAAWQIINPF